MVKIPVHKQQVNPLTPKISAPDLCRQNKRYQPAGYTIATKSSRNGGAVPDATARNAQNSGGEFSCKMLFPVDN